MTVVAWVLVALGVLVLVLTQVRLRASGGQVGMVDFAPWVLDAHSLTGGIGLLLIALRLLDVHTSGLATGVAILALVLASLLGLSFLARWRRSGGRHTVEAVGDAWTKGPWLSQLAHIGLTLGTVFFAWAMLSDRI